MLPSIYNQILAIEAPAMLTFAFLKQLVRSSNLQVVPRVSKANADWTARFGTKSRSVFV